jgi:FAD/FMN-containing dehydrogenase
MRRAPNASVGYVGWATLGGYSPLSTKYGLGVDHIVGAKYVNGEGTLVDAGEEELKAMRGGGGCLGIITEMTIKVHSLKEVRFIWTYIELVCVVANLS